MSLSYHPFHCWVLLFPGKLLSFLTVLSGNDRKRRPGAGEEDPAEKRGFLSFCSLFASFLTVIAQTPL